MTMSESPGGSAKRPNILLIMCDQLNASVLGCYGGPVDTPNIDSIAAGGVRFTDATCPYPVCSPSRASLLTGLYPHAHGIIHNVNRRDYPAIGSPAGEEGLHVDDVTTDRLLSEAGYETHHYGKLHLLDDDLPYYPDMFTEHDGYARWMAEEFERVSKTDRRGWMDWYGWRLPVAISPAMAKATAELNGRLTGQYVEFIEKIGRLEMPVERTFDYQVAQRGIDAVAASGDRPFMVTCSFNWPHDPNVVPSPYYEMFDPDSLELPANFESCEAFLAGDWSRQTVLELGEPLVREFLRIYYACVKMIDDQVGRLLAALDAAGKADDTLVIFTADHGDMAGGHGMVWKSTSAFYDELVRVPRLMRLPGRMPAGLVSDAVTSHVDIMPTVGELAGVAIPAGRHGRSLVGLLSGEGDGEAPQYSFCERIDAHPLHLREVLPDRRACWMVRGGGWKYADTRAFGGGEALYDLAGDPGETVNLADDPARTAMKAQLQDVLLRWRRQGGCPVDC